MSVEAISLALSADVERSSTKFVLVAMANCANADMTCWPSVQYLSDATSQDRKTVLENIKRLKDSGFIEDTGGRTGATGQVIIYRLTFSEQTQKRNSSKNGTVPKFPPKSPEIPAKESRNSAETGPKTGHGTVREPSLEPSGNVVPAKRISKKTRLPDDFYPNDTGLQKASEAGVVLADELESFMDHHRAKGSTMDDWQAAWRTWVRNAVKFGGSRRQQKQPIQTIHDKRANTIAALTGRTNNERTATEPRDITAEAIRVA